MHESNNLGTIRQRIEATLQGNPVLLLLELPEWGSRDRLFYPPSHFRSNEKPLSFKTSAAGLHFQEVPGLVLGWSKTCWNGEGGILSRKTEDHVEAFTAADLTGGRWRLSWNCLVRENDHLHAFVLHLGGSRPSRLGFVEFGCASWGWETPVSECAMRHMWNYRAMSPDFSIKDGSACGPSFYIRVYPSRRGRNQTVLSLKDGQDPFAGRLLESFRKGLGLRTPAALHNRVTDYSGFAVQLLKLGSQAKDCVSFAQALAWM